MQFIFFKFVSLGSGEATMLGAANDKILSKVEVTNGEERRTAVHEHAQALTAETGPIRVIKESVSKLHSEKASSNALMLELEQENSIMEKEEQDGLSLLDTINHEETLVQQMCEKAVQQADTDSQDAYQKALESKDEFASALRVAREKAHKYQKCEHDYRVKSVRKTLLEGASVNIRERAKVNTDLNKETAARVIEDGKHRKRMFNAARSTLTDSDNAIKRSIEQGVDLCGKAGCLTYALWGQVEQECSQQMHDIQNKICNLDEKILDASEEIRGKKMPANEKVEHHNSIKSMKNEQATLEQEHNSIEELTTTVYEDMSLLLAQFVNDIQQPDNCTDNQFKAELKARMESHEKQAWKDAEEKYPVVVDTVYENFSSTGSAGTSRQDQSVPLTMMLGQSASPAECEKFIETLEKRIMQKLKQELKKNSRPLAIGYNSPRPSVSASSNV